jgi:hypothetical protein
MPSPFGLFDHICLVLKFGFTVMGCPLRWESKTVFLAVVTVLSVIHIYSCVLCVLILVLKHLHLYTVWKWPPSVHTYYSWSCLVLLNFCYSSSLVTGTIINLTVTKFKLLKYLCWVLICCMLQRFVLSWFCMASICYLHNFKLKSCHM